MSKMCGLAEMLVCPIFFSNTLRAKEQPTILPLPGWLMVSHGHSPTQTKPKMRWFLLLVLAFSEVVWGLRCNAVRKIMWVKSSQVWECQGSPSARLCYIVTHNKTSFFWMRRNHFSTSRIWSTVPVLFQKQSSLGSILSWHYAMSDLSHP